MATKTKTTVRAFMVDSRIEINQSKIDKMYEILPLYQATMSYYLSDIIKDFQQGNPIPKFLAKDKKCTTYLSNTGLNRCAFTQVTATLTSWYGQLVNVIRDYITRSSLDPETKKALYKINKWKAWYSKDYDKFDPEHLAIARHIIKHVTKHKVRRPVVKHVRTMVLNEGCALDPAQKKSSEIDLYFRMPSLVPRKAIKLPIKLTNYCKNTPGDLCKCLAICLPEDGKPILRVLKKIEVDNKREDGKTLFLHFGLINVFTDSENRMHGLSLYQKLKAKDALLTKYIAKQQQHHDTVLGKKFKHRDDPYVAKMTRQIRSMVDNEVNRILNRIARENQGTDEQWQTIVVEDLDFRGGGLSKTLNRIVSKAGRGAVRQKLLDLEERYGIEITAQNPAYNSQQCSGCGAIVKTSRNSKDLQKFCCKFCGKKIHADINAVRNMRRRQERNYSLMLRSGLLLKEQAIFEQQWGVTPEYNKRRTRVAA